VGFSPVARVSNTAPSLARIFVSVLLPEFVIHTLAPSNAISAGLVPVAIVSNI
jgi:hypothetical protein